MSLIVKICGLSTEETLDAALAAGADMVGFELLSEEPALRDAGARRANWRSASPAAPRSWR